MKLRLVDNGVAVQGVSTLGATDTGLRGAVHSTGSVGADRPIHPLDADSVAPESVVDDTHPRAIADVDTGVVVIADGVSFDHLITACLDEDAKAGVVLGNVITEAAISHADICVHAVAAVVDQTVALDHYVVADDHVYSAAAPAWIASEHGVEVQVVVVNVVVKELDSI